MKRIEDDKILGNKWRFTGNNFHEDKGLDTSDMETFRRDPISSLAREICQNSIDAKKEGEKHVKVVFQTFKIKRNNIPGIDRVKEEIISCMNYQKSKDNIKNVETLEHMLNEINKEDIECLRISDYHTTGLTGVNDYFEGEGTFRNLTRKSGDSAKGKGKGGSKGVGKYASFVVSNFNTVFYSTLSVDGGKGFLGISKLCSTIYDEETKERTEGTGYYGKNFQGEPITGEQLNIEPGYVRDETGTDIYILGFNESELWKAEIITKILDSFMAAILYDELVVKVDDIDLNSQNLSSIIENNSLIIGKAKDIKNIKAQYQLLSDSTIVPHDIDMGVYGTAKLYLKAYNKDEAEKSTQECTMIRYPYMKITALKNIVHVPFSAACVIEDNKLNECLRAIENPQHDSWDIHELDKKPMLQEEVKNMKKSFIDKIYDYIQEALSIANTSESDIEGAGEFLPSSEADYGDKTDGENIINDIATVVPFVKVKHKESKVQMENEDGIGLEPAFVEREEGEGSPVPTGENHGGGGEPHDGENETGFGNEEGDQESFKLAPLSGVNYRMMCLNKNNGEYIISFTSPQNANNCELAFKIVDDNSNKEKVNVLSANVNGIDCVIKDGKVVNFDLKNGEKYKIKIKTNLNDYYCGEVGISYESR